MKETRKDLSELANNHISAELLTRTVTLAEPLLSVRTQASCLV